MDNKISDLDFDWIGNQWDNVINEKSDKNGGYFNNVDSDIWKLEQKRDYVFVEPYLSKDSVVLDFGCGLGKMAEILHDEVAIYVGVDVSGEAIKRAIVRCGKDNCNFFINKSPDLTLFDDETFDLVFSMVTFQHIPKEVVIHSYVPEIFRVLKKNGSFVLQFVDHLGYHSPQRLAETNKDILEKKIFKWGGTISSYKKEELEELFNKFPCDFKNRGFTGKGTSFEKLNTKKIIWHIVEGQKI